MGINPLRLPPDDHVLADARTRKGYEEFQRMTLEEKTEKLRAMQAVENSSLSPEERERALTPLQQAHSASHKSGMGEQEDGFEAQLQAQLAQLPPEKRAEAEAQIRKAYAEFQRMSPEEQARALQVANDQSNRAQIDNAANKAREAGLAYVRKQAPRKDILEYLNDMAQKAAEGEKPGSPWLDVAALCDALIKEEPVPPVPAVYASHFSAVQSQMKKE